MIEVNSLKLNNLIDNNTKTTANSSNNSTDFKDMLSKSEYRNSSKGNVDSKEYRKYSSAKEISGNDKLSDRDFNKISSEVRDLLKKEGLQDEDIDNIKSLGDLENCLKNKVSKGELNIDNLLAILAMMMNITSEDINKANGNLIDDISKAITNKLQEVIGKDKNPNIDNSIKTIIDSVESIVDKKLAGAYDLLKKLEMPEEFKGKLIEKISSDVMDKISSNTNQGKDELIYSKLKSEISTILTSKLKPEVKKTEDLSSAIRIDLNNSAAVKEDLVVNSTADKNKGDNNYSLLKDNGSQNEEEILKKILDGGSSDKLSKVTNFMSQFNNVKLENSGTDLGSLVVNKNSFSSDVIKSLKYMNMNNIKELTVKIAPKELGQITINLIMESGKLKAILTASNKEAYSLLNSNLTDLSNKLQNNDIKIQSFSLNVYNEDTTFFRDKGNREENNQKDKERKTSSIGAIGEEIDELKEEEFLDNNVNILA